MAGGGGGGGQKQDDLAPHPVKDQLPGVSYCITSPPPWRQYLFSPHPLLSSARLLPVGLLVAASAAQILGVRSGPVRAFFSRRRRVTTMLCGTSRRFRGRGFVACGGRWSAPPACLLRGEGELPRSAWAFPGPVPISGYSKKLKRIAFSFCSPV
jgi:hypothetical protein